MRKNIKVSLASLLILIVSFTLIYYTTSAFTTSSKNPSITYFTDINGQPQPLTKEVRENNPNQVRVCGLLVGRDNTNYPNYGTVAIYSPVDGIQRDLTLIWGPP